MARERDESSGAPWHYDLHFTEGLRAASVTLCAPGARLPARLVLGERQLMRYLHHPALVTPERVMPLDVVDDGLDVSDAPEEACVRWSVDLQAAAKGEGSERSARRVGDDLVLSPDLLLLRPPQVSYGQSIEARVELPEGLKLSAPWARTRPGVYAVPASALYWRGRLVVGDLERFDVDVEGGVLEVAVVGGDLDVERDVITRWLQRSARSVSSLYGQFPRERTQVTLTPVPAFGDPVPFGLVVRGGGPGVHMLVARGASASALDEDWVAPHELSHLLTPFISSRDCWLSEGLATYYQSVARVRAGTMEEEEAWQKLLEGFDRGRDAVDGKTLAESSAAQRRERNYMRVYWAGAAFALLGDVALHTRPDRPASLADGLSALRECCLSAGRPFSARDVTERMDAALGGSTLTDVLEEMVDAREFPELEPTLRALGVRRERGRVVLNQGPLAHVRAAIMGSDARLAKAR